MKLGIMKWTGRDRQGVWIVVECRYRQAGFRDRILMARARRRRWAAARQIAWKASRMMLRVLAAAGTTYLYTAWAMEQAYLQRGYMAYGGECLIVPFVFYGVYRAIVSAERLACTVRQRISERGTAACRERGIREAARPRE